MGVMYDLTLSRFCTQTLMSIKTAYKKLKRKTSLRAKSMENGIY